MHCLAHPGCRHPPPVFFFSVQASSKVLVPHHPALVVARFPALLSPRSRRVLKTRRPPPFVTIRHENAGVSSLVYRRCNSLLVPQLLTTSKSNKRTSIRHGLHLTPTSSCCTHPRPPRRRYPRCAAAVATTADLAPPHRPGFRKSICVCSRPVKASRKSS